MRKLLVVLLVTLIAVPTFQACKKGPNDPLISFKSRNARITAKWKLTKIEGTETKVTAGVSNATTTTFDGTTKTVTSSLFGTTTTSTGVYEMTIEKNGTMTWSETYISGTPATTDVQTGSGPWIWLNTDKNKTDVDLTGGHHFFSSGFYVIDRLASKELVLTTEQNSNNNGDTDVANYKFTFTAE
ncbi:MAG: hypothetical protein WCL06_05495 [Bacteroidota bacterium]